MAFCFFFLEEGGAAPVSRERWPRSAQVGQGAHQEPCVNCTAGTGTAAGGQGKEGRGTSPAETQSKSQRGPFTRAQQWHVLVLPCYASAVIKFPL